MKVSIYRCIAVFFLLALLFCFAACSLSKTPTAAQNAKKEELAQKFMNDLYDNILPVKDRTSLLANIGVMVSKEEDVADMAPFWSFVEKAGAGEDTSVTIAFIGKSYIVSRLDYVNGAGYYFRYEYNENEPISVTSKVFDDYEVTTDEKLGKVALSLRYDNKETAAMIFRPQGSGGDE